MKYLRVIALCVSVMCGDSEFSEFVDFKKLETEFHLHTFKNKQTMNVDEFSERVERNSINLAKSRAMAQSLLYEGKSMRAWNSSYVEAESNNIKAPGGGTQMESNIVLMLAPRLPWVTYTLAQSYQNKILRQEKSYELTKRLALIAAKRLYLDYLILKEQYQIYISRYENAKNQLKFSQIQYEVGRISKSQFLFFKSDFLTTEIGLKTSHKDMLDALNALKVILGVTAEDSDLIIEGLIFDFLVLDKANIEQTLSQSLYLDIIALDIKDYQYSASVASQSRFDSFEIGGGISKAESSDGVMFRVKVPIPLTTKYGNQKAMFLALQSGSIRESEILKDSLLVSAQSYLQQLLTQEEIISLAVDNEDNRAKLSEIARIGYDAGKTSAFEYLSVKNEHLNAMIATTQAKRNYIQILAKLEETLSSVLNLTPSTNPRKEES
ncbi:TolC family protein [Helicobacter jaachi]|uniref:TolC family protein n=1 Tax=Helicobacter jaachi TaxID=1677920 RepID=A0A4U8TF82_9HELI|nr:TolC family protein [Helicobacter jaachi]TLD97377.1 TolC family protein [Helicobacter jaachi]